MYNSTSVKLQLGQLVLTCFLTGTFYVCSDMRKPANCTNLVRGNLCEKCVHFVKTAINPKLIIHFLSRQTTLKGKISRSGTICYTNIHKLAICFRKNLCSNQDNLVRGHFQTFLMSVFVILHFVLMPGSSFFYFLSCYIHHHLSREKLS